MSSELYWNNMAVRNPLQVREIVHARLRELENFLNVLRRRLKETRYEFEFSSVNKVLKFRGDDYVYLKKAVKILDRGNVLKYYWDGKSHEITVSDFPEAEELDLHLSNGLQQKVRVSREIFILGIVAKNVPEDQEDHALDVLRDAKYVHDENSCAIKVIESVINEKKIILEQVPFGRKFVVQQNEYVINRQIDAIRQLVTHPRPSLKPLLDLLQSNEYASWGAVERPDISHYFVLPNNDSEPATEEQKDFVRKALGTPDFAILEGPPGSGKTTTLLELIIQLAVLGKRILMVGSTHVAVDNLLERLTGHQDGKSLAAKYGIVPVRVGAMDSISERIAGFHLSRLRETEKSRLIKFLSSVKRTHAQEVLYQAIIGNDGSKTIEDVILDSVNLVCGTTIGVLQSPLMNSNSAIEFDYLIIDEASKTTFQEFLVPALHAARWIISGDTRQLSPYTDRLMLISAIQHIPTMAGKDGERDRKICADVFRSYINSKERVVRGCLVVYPDASDLPEKYRIQVEAINKIAREQRGEPGVSMLILDSPPVEIKSMLDIMGANLVMVPKSKLAEVEQILPADLEKSDLSDGVLSPEFAQRKEAFERYVEKLDFKSRDSEEWEGEIAWRLLRIYGLRDNPAQQESYILDLRMLVPYFSATDQRIGTQVNNEQAFKTERPRSDRVLNELQRLKEMAFPSILELIEHGYSEGSEENEQRNHPLRNGLPETVLSERRTILSYQRRMHPEISAFPRQHVYNGNALKDSVDMEKKREWGCGIYRKRMVWLDVLPRKEDYRSGTTTRNFAEIGSLMIELEHFMQWARKNRCLRKESNGIWEVAILTFYKGQEKEIMRRIQRWSGKASSQYFDLKTDNVVIELGTVDRFQGHEADVVFISFAKSRGQIGFLDNLNRLNVALTRARYQLVIIGDRRNFIKSGRSTEVLRQLAEYSEGPIRYRGEKS